MNALPLAVPRISTLADQLGDTLDDALASGATSGPWCGGEAIAAVADRWTGRVILRCGECGSELEGVGRRRAREGRA